MTEGDEAGRLLQQVKLRADTALGFAGVAIVCSLVALIVALARL
jgi:hypothetical protein